MGKMNMVIGTLAHFWAKNNDKIEMAAGMAAVGAGTVLLIKNSGKIADVTEEYKYRMSYAEYNDDKPDEEEKKEVKKAAIKEAAVGYVKTVGPGVGLIVAGEVLQGISHATLTQKLTTVSASLATVGAAFDRYRQNVVADQGAEKDYEYMVGPVSKTVEVKQDGTVVETTTPVHAAGDPKFNYIPHSFMFDESCEEWTDNPTVNREFLERRLVFINQALDAKEYLTENEMRAFFNLPPTIAGQAAGAKRHEKDGSLNTISIGIEAMTEAAQRFRDGIEPSFLAIFQYADGRPIENNILDDVDWEKY